MQACAVVCAFEPEGDTELAAEEGDLLHVSAHDGDWVFAHCPARRTAGWIPMSFLVVQSEHDDAADASTLVLQPADALALAETSTVSFFERGGYRNES